MQVGNKQQQPTVKGKVKWGMGTRQCAEGTERIQRESEF